jgi:hypothetical protein
MTQELVPSPARLFTPTPKAAKRVRDFFTAQLRNDHTRKGARRARHPGLSAAPHRCIHQQLQDRLTPPTVKQHLAALRMLFDWLVIGHVIDVNPAHAVRGPKYIVRKGKTSVLTAEEARELLDSIPLVRNVGRRRKGQGGITEAITGRVARSRAHRGDGLQLRPHQRRARDERARTTSSKADADGCAFTKKAARSTRHRVTTIWKSTSMNILPQLHRP